MLEDEGFGHFRQTLELDEGGIGEHFLHLFAVFDVDVRKAVLLVVVDGEAVARCRAFAAETLHLRTYLLVAERSEGCIVGDGFTVAGDDDFGQRLDGEIIHCLDFLAGVTQEQQAPEAHLELRYLCFGATYLVVYLHDAGHMFRFFVEVFDFVERKP